MPDDQMNDRVTPDAAAPADEPAARPSPDGSRLVRFKNWYGGHKLWTIPLTVLIILLVLAAIPWSRYSLAGTVRKSDFEVQVMDSTTNTPVSAATVSAGGQTAETNSTGVATLKDLRTGYHQFTVSKKYYQSQTGKLLAPILKQKSVPSFKLVATGRQVKITVSNLVTKTKLGNVDIQVAGITAKTNASGSDTGSAIVVLPAGVSQEKATLSLDGYNDASVTVLVSGDKIQENDFTLTPAGKVYFLSNLSGKIDLVKTNLDGSGRQTVLAGTGNEDPHNTLLLASRDWKYLALLSRRAGNFASLYLIDTSDDNVSNIDEGDAYFDLVGWSGHNFIYDVTRNDVNVWQAKHQVIKSFNADKRKLNMLDQTAGQGTSNNNYVAESYTSVNIAGGIVVFAKTWNYSYSPLYPQAPTMHGRYAGIYSVNPDGTNLQKLKTFDYGMGAGTNILYGVLNYINALPYSPSGVYYQESSYNNGNLSASSYYEYDGGKLTQNSSIAQTYNKEISSGYPTYLISPSGSRTFWSEPRDGKNTLFVGDEDGGSQKQIAALSDYSPYGWYTDNYLMVSKDSSELYIMAKDDSQPPVKISDYYKPDVSFQGYGGGYGGL